MIGLDTNVLVRYLTQDEPRQAALATRIVEEQLTAESPGFIGIIVLVETVWVLQRRYRASEDEIRETIEHLLGSLTLCVENRDVVIRALSVCGAQQCGFADALIAASAASGGCERTVTFDRRAVRAGMVRIDR
jgi:predicted nucleic-acid-binding protein